MTLPKTLDAREILVALITPFDGRSSGAALCGSFNMSVSSAPMVLGGVRTRPGHLSLACIAVRELDHSVVAGNRAGSMADCGLG
jgi:hypothetical protein